MERNNVVIGSKVVTFRLPADLAAEFEVHCGELGTTHGELLRKMVDERLYPGRAELDSPEQLHPELYGVKATERIAELVNAQIKEQLQEQLGPMVDEKLELVQIDRGLSEADKEGYKESLDALEQGLAGQERGLVDLKDSVNNLVQTVNANVEVCNEEFRKIARLYQFLAAHGHDGKGMIVVSPMELLEAEVKLADKRSGKIKGLPDIIEGKTALQGYHYLEYLNLSVWEK